MKDDEKYVDKELVENLLHMFEGTEGDKNVAAQIFDNVLHDDNDFNDFMETWDEIIDEKKAKIIVESNPMPDRKYEVNKHYLKLCLEHTAWSMKNDVRGGLE